MAEAAETPTRQSQLHQRLVIDIVTTEELGRLSHFLVDVKNHQIEGFVCKRGVLGLETLPIMWVQIESIGQDSIVVRRSEPVSGRLDEAIVLDQQSVWADSGNSVGQLADYCIDLKTGAITQYLFTAPGLQGLKEGVFTFQPESVVSIGKKRMMVHQAALEQAPQFAPGVQERFSSAFRQDVDQTRADVRGVVDNSREIADQVQVQAKKLGDQARSQFGQMLGQVKKQTKTLRSEVNDRFADAASNLQSLESRSRQSPPKEAIDVDAEEIWTEEEDDSQSQS